MSLSNEDYSLILNKIKECLGLYFDVIIKKRNEIKSPKYIGDLYLKKNIINGELSQKFYTSLKYLYDKQVGFNIDIEYAKLLSSFSLVNPKNIEDFLKYIILYTNKPLEQYDDIIVEKNQEISQEDMIKLKKYKEFQDKINQIKKKKEDRKSLHLKMYLAYHSLYIWRLWFISSS